MNTSFGPWATPIYTGAPHQQLDTFWKSRLAMLPLINQTASRAARRTWLLLGVAGILALALPTTHMGTQPRVAGAAGGSATAADLSEKGPGDSIAERGREPSGQFKTGNTGVAVEYLPRPTKEETALEEPLDLDVVDMSFEDCIKLFAKQAKINVLLDYQTLADEGVALDAPITLNLQGGRAGSVLNRLLEPRTLAVLFEDDYLKITTAARAGEWLIVRWYPVWDLYPGSADAQPKARPKPRRQGMGSYEATGEFDLITAITTTVEPDSWEDLSGPGSVAYVKEIQCLAIRQTGSAHREILQLLRLWREAKRLRRAAAASFAPLRPATSTDGK